MKIDGVVVDASPLIVLCRGRLVHLLPRLFPRILVVIFSQMPLPVPLSAVVNALDWMFEEASTYLDRTTGEIETVSHEALRWAEEESVPERVPDWQRKEIDSPFASSTAKIFRLPPKWDVHEWAIMERFVFSLHSGELREAINSAIHGAGAFRLFKRAIHEYGIQDDWYEFRARALRGIAIEWCEHNAIPYVDNTGSRSAKTGPR